MVCSDARPSSALSRRIRPRRSNRGVSFGPTSHASTRGDDSASSPLSSRSVHDAWPRSSATSQAVATLSFLTAPIAFAAAFSLCQSRSPRALDSGEGAASIRTIGGRSARQPVPIRGRGARPRLSVPAQVHWRPCRADGNCRARFPPTPPRATTSVQHQLRTGLHQDGPPVQHQLRTGLHRTGLNINSGRGSTGRGSTRDAHRRAVGPDAKPHYHPFGERGNHHIFFDVLEVFAP